MSASTEGKKKSEVTWEKVKLEDIAEVVPGQSPKSEFYNENGEGLPFYQGKAQFGELYPEVEKWCTDPKKKAQPGDVLMTVRAPVGALNIADEECIIGRGLSAIRAKNGNSRFIYYLLKANRDHIESFAGGSVYDSITKKATKNLEFRIPSSEKREEITDILSSFDRLIETNKRRIEILEETARLIYREWFVNFNFPGSEDIELKDCDLGFIPQNWRMKFHDDLLEYHIGGSWGEEEPTEEHNNPIHVIRGTDIPDLKKLDKSETPRRFLKQSHIDSRKLEDGDIIFEVSGGSKDQPVGRNLFVTNELINFFPDTVICASFCKLLRPNDQVAEPEWFYFYLDDLYKSRKIDEFQVQSTGIKNLKFKHFRNGKIALPPVELQKKFSNKVRPLITMINILGKQNHTLRQIRDLLLPRLVSGDIEV